MKKPGQPDLKGRKGGDELYQRRQSVTRHARERSQACPAMTVWMVGYGGIFPSWGMAA
jgi:hypothetical protein